AGVRGGGAGWAAVLERALDEDPARRQPTVEAVLAALDRATDGKKRKPGPTTLPGTGPAPSPARPAVREPSPASFPSGEVTRQVDEEDLKRLAGEVSELLETTRQVPLEEIAPLRAQ